MLRKSQSKPDHAVVLGLDTGFASVGWSVCHMGPSAAGKSLVVDQCGTFRTEPNAKKLKIKVGDDDFHRSQLITRHIIGLVDLYKPRVICCEAFSPMRNAGTVAKVGRCFGVLAAIAELRDIPILHATPMEIKKATHGVGTASKDEVQVAVDRATGGTALRALDQSKVPNGQREHAYDSVGAIIACWDAEVLRLLRSA